MEYKWTYTPQSEWIHHEKVKYVVLFENLELEIKCILREFGEDCNLARANNSGDVQYELSAVNRDAISFSDFIERIEVSHDDLENNAQLGFVNGITKIIMDNLNQLTLYERPIHCTDVKRETMYIKDKDVWDKKDVYHIFHCCVLI